MAGAVIPLSWTYPASAAGPSSHPVMLAQTEEQPCPEGQECPPAQEQQAAPEEGKKKLKDRVLEKLERRKQELQGKQAPQEQEQPQQEQQPAAAEPQPQQEEQQPAAAEPQPQREPEQQQAAPERKKKEKPQQQAAPEPQPAPEQLAAPEEPQPAPAEGAKKSLKERALEKLQRRKQQLQGKQAPEEQPAQEQQAAPEKRKPKPEQQAAPEQQPAPEQEAQQPPKQRDRKKEANNPPTEEPAPQESTVEQQLEAQGDKEQAKKVRTLREELLDQLQQATGAPPQEEDTSKHDRKRSERDRNGNQSGDRNANQNRDQNGQRADRRDRYYDRGAQRDDVVEERGGRIVIDLGGGNIYVEPTVPDDADRLLYGADDVEVQNLRYGRTRTIVHRPDGVDIVTVRDRYGDIIKRSRVLPNGREIVLIDNRYADENVDHRRPPAYLNDVPPPRVRIPRDRYVVDLGRASDEDIRYALQAPLVQAPPRAYTLDEVLRNEQVRAYSPRIDLDTITFEFGSATISDSQMGSLYELGQAMEQVIAENPDEVYLIEGHTDAVGSDYDNLILSDQRAEAVATALSQNFNIPPENLVTEGYGEQYLKIDTEGPERRNRRATVRRLTDLLQAEAQ